MTYTGGKSKSNLFGSTAQNNVVINPKSCQRKPLQPGKMFVFCFLHSQNAHISQAGGQSTTILHHLKSIKVTGNNLKRSKMEDDGTRWHPHQNSNEGVTPKQADLSGPNEPDGFLNTHLPEITAIGGFLWAPLGKTCRTTNKQERGDGEDKAAMHGHTGVIWSF